MTTGRAVALMDQPMFSECQARGQVQLTSDRSDQVSCSDILHLTDCPSRFDIDHVCLVSKQTFEEFLHLSLDTEEY